MRETLHYLLYQQIVKDDPESSAELMEVLDYPTHYKGDFYL